MTEVEIDRTPPAVRLLYGTAPSPNWLTMTYGELVAYRAAENRKRASRLARLITGFPDHRATIEWQILTLPDREVAVRVYRPSEDLGGKHEDLPLVLHVHGGGFLGAAPQCDWANSHLAAQLPAVVVSVEHRLLDHRTPLSAAFDDGWDILEYAVRVASSRWGAGCERVGVVGESMGGLIAALMAIRAKEQGLLLKAQVLVNPVTDLTSAGFGLPSMKQHAASPACTREQMQLLQRLAAPTPTELQSLSPMCAGDLSGLAPALVVVPTVDPVADHGRRYAGRLRTAGTQAHLIEYPGAPHAFLTMPRLVREAKAARVEILEFLKEHLEVGARAWVPGGRDA